MKSLYNFLTGKGQLLALVLAVVCIVAVLGSIFSGLGSAGYDAGTDLVQILKDEDSTQDFAFFAPAVVIPVLLIGFALVALVVAGVASLVSDPKGSMKFLASAGVVVVLFLIFYATSESETTGKIFELMQTNDIGEGTSKFISGGIKTTILLVAASAVTMIGGEIYNIFK